MTISQISKELVYKLFKKYYFIQNIDFPFRGDKKEWAFIYFDDNGFMQRPVTFKYKSNMNNWFEKRVPKHAYYSGAYYSNPSVPMVQKEWEGAELLFDLDGDHIPNAKNMSFVEQLEAIKTETKKLLDVLLMNFGLKPSKIKLYFSGGRGYHIHYIDDDYVSLGKKERTEIVNYINSIGKAKTKHETSNPNQMIFIDGVVTKDIKRIIRVPGSLHGGTGFIVKEIKIEDLNRFNPFNDSLAKQVGSKIIDMVGLKPLDIMFRNKDYFIRKNIPFRCPLPEAMFFILKEYANIIE